MIITFWKDNGLIIAHQVEDDANSIQITEKLVEILEALGYSEESVHNAFIDILNR